MTLIMMIVKKKMNDNDDEDMARVTSGSNILHDGPGTQGEPLCPSSDDWRD